MNTEPGPPGFLQAYRDGERGAGYGFDAAHGEAPVAVVEVAGPDLETVFAPTGRGWLDLWVDDPHTNGSYSYWAISQHTELRGAAGPPEVPIHFCGEHTSLEHQEFANGAVETVGGPPLTSWGSDD